jgi:hypothetical protein
LEKEEELSSKEKIFKLTNEGKNFYRKLGYWEFLLWNPVHEGEEGLLVLLEQVLYAIRL